jgi:beta-1,2-mannosidase
LGRLDRPFFRPEMSYEKTGQYEAGTTFCEGLIWFHGRWLIYYGCADSFVGVAVSQ